MFDEVGAPESSFGTENYINIRSVHFVSIRFQLNNPRFNK